MQQAAVIKKKSLYLTNLLPLRAPPVTISVLVVLVFNAIFSVRYPVTSLHGSKEM